MPTKPHPDGRRTSRGHGYPRPQLVREDWTSLNGVWDFALDLDAQWDIPEEVDWTSSIQVPFAPETSASGIENTSFYQACWYRRAIPTPRIQAGQRLLLHFGAVDWEAAVWVNGKLAVHHEGGYTPFQADITDLLVEGNEQVIAVRAYDNPHELHKPRGKQDWCLNAHSIWYWRTTGIWQTVWMEAVPATWISSIKWTPNVERWEIQLQATVAGEMREELRVHVWLTHKERILVDDVYAVTGGKVDRRISLNDPGIDDYRNDYYWSPSHPNLMHAEIELVDGEGNVIDSISSYTAMRSATIQGDRFMLNTRPYQLRLVLNQGYWPDTGLTAPDDEALRRDVELIKAMGFNGVRMHQKIEDPRFLYWADTLGLLVWEEMPSAYAFGDETVRRVTDTWMAAIKRDFSHPCIVAWVPINESWGVPDLPNVAQQRHFVRSLYHLTKTLDPTRPVIGNDGWESVVTDIIAIHDYEADPARIARRYTVNEETLAQMLHSERPGHRILILDEQAHAGLPIMLTEFGGIAFSKQRGTWGYSRAKTPDDFAARYAALLETVRTLPLLAGFCYTQFTDTYQEANGLLYMDRKPKFPLEQITIATRGPESDSDRRVHNRWRQRLLAMQRQQSRALREETLQEGD